MDSRIEIEYHSLCGSDITFISREPKSYSSIVVPASKCKSRERSVPHEPSLCAGAGALRMRARSSSTVLARNRWARSGAVFGEETQHRGRATPRGGGRGSGGGNPGPVTRRRQHLQTSGLAGSEAQRDLLLHRHQRARRRRICFHGGWPAGRSR